MVSWLLTRGPPKIVVHSLTDVCWKKCVTTPIKQGALDKNEQACMANCADRFLDVSNLTMQHLAKLRQG
jgi:mitochondrial import inner membrane translocase subunit TIM8